MKTVAQARAVVDLLQREVERELFGARGPVERAELKAEHAGLRELSDRIAGAGSGGSGGAARGVVARGR